MQVVELMGESLFFIAVPYQLLRIFIDDDTRGVRQLDTLGTLVGQVEAGSSVFAPSSHLHYHGTHLRLGGSSSLAV